MKTEFKPLWFLAKKVESISHRTPGDPTHRCELSIVLVANSGMSSRDSAVEVIEKMREIVKEYDELLECTKALPPETPSPDATPALLGEHPSDSTTA